MHQAGPDAEPAGAEGLSGGRTRRSNGDLVVVGVGVEPRVELAERAGLAAGTGILVNDRLETTASGIFRAGDVANTWHPLLGTRCRPARGNRSTRIG